ncbi:IDEAL domain-containing protein [Sporolactobacillus sp. CPB3-1]|uniref:IDEAL domain-containing protein n=1 Tax=Sporolactobacillus mangiferae TaxID=2940498 RepID=A0ABT0M665_9BACL|nr:IDEAL domain-containing protein [Sporolactobacillus mangiferae]MCL1630357.1 IDEAL domain-containing protein [Sporolactobacillus mangiferae]
MEVGQWVYTKYMGKHDCIGFVTSVYPDFRRCKIRVTQCENHPRMKWLEISFEDILPEKYDFTRLELDSLIDLALATYDKDWFEQLTALQEYI